MTISAEKWREFTITTTLSEKLLPGYFSLHNRPMYLLAIVVIVWYFLVIPEYKMSLDFCLWSVLCVTLSFYVLFI